MGITIPIDIHGQRHRSYIMEKTHKTSYPGIIPLCHISITCFQFNSTYPSHIFKLNLTHPKSDIENYFNP